MRARERVVSAEEGLHPELRGALTVDIMSTCAATGGHVFRVVDCFLAHDVVAHGANLPSVCVCVCVCCLAARAKHEVRDAHASFIGEACPFVVRQFLCNLFGAL